MIITRVELRNARLIDGQTIRQFRRTDGFDIRRDGCALVVSHETGWGIEMPYSDVLTAHTEAGFPRGEPVVPVGLPEVRDQAPTRVTKRPTKAEPNV